MYPSQWLDLLPPEICDRIAAHVSRGKQSESALYLSQTSPVQRLAVWNALSHSIVINLRGTPRQEQDAVRWADVYYDYPLSVKCFRVTPIATYLLARSCVHRVTITENEDLLLALRNSTSIRELHLSLAWSPTILQLLFETLSTLHITKLAINDGRPFTGTSTAEHLCGVLASSCPHLQALSFDFIRPFPPPSSVWPAFRKLPALSDVNVNNKVPAHAIPVLRALASVTIHSACPSLASRIGPAVTKYNSLFDDALQASEIGLLMHCPRLLSLEVHIEPGSEDELLRLVRALPSLQTLALNWGRDDGAIPYVEAKRDSILQIVEAAPNLTELRLYGVRVCVAAVEAILKTMGDRLKVLLLPVNGQEDSALERLQRILITAIESCAGLRELIVTGGGEEVERWEWWYERIERLTDMLQTRAPFLDSQIAKNILGPDRPKFRIMAQP